MEPTVAHVASRRFGARERFLACQHRIAAQIISWVAIVATSVVAELLLLPLARLWTNVALGVATIVVLACVVYTTSTDPGE